VRLKILLAIFITFFIVSCSDSINPTSSNIDNGGIIAYLPVPGQVVAGFADTSNYSSIVFFLQQLKLTVVSIDADSSFTFWVQVYSGEIDKHLEWLSQNTEIAWAQQSGYSKDPQKEYIILHFMAGLSVEFARNLINSKEGLKVKETIYSTKMGVVKVKIGAEQQWIDSLKTFSFVKWAEQNYATHISGNQ